MEQWGTINYRIIVITVVALIIGKYYNYCVVGCIFCSYQKWVHCPFEYHMLSHHDDIFISLIIYDIRNAIWISKTLSILVSLPTLRVKPKPNNRCILEHLLLFFFVNFKELKGSLNSVKHELHRNDSSQATSGNPCVARYIIADKSNIKG